MPIPSCLVDTNILLRIARLTDPQHELIDGALAKLPSDRCKLYFTHQNIAEVWNVMTRPLARNGFGRVPHSFALFAKGWGSTTLNLLGF